MRQTKNIAALYRAISGLPVERQRELCQEAARSLGVRRVLEYNADDDAAALREWLAGLSSTDVAMVANLLVIPDWRAPKARPSAVLARTVVDIASRSVLISVLDGVSSVDGAAWAKAVGAAIEAISSGGRKLPRKRAQVMARASHSPKARRQRGVVKRWKSPGMAKVREQWARVWRDPDYSSAQEAFAALPDDVKSDINSLESARRIFGKRRPGDKRAGGRPRKT